MGQWLRQSSRTSHTFSPGIFQDGPLPTCLDAPVAVTVVGNARALASETPTQTQLLQPLLPSLRGHWLPVPVRVDTGSEFLVVR